MPFAVPAYDRAPFLVIWETTRACDLACRHCRASAQPQPLPGELTGDEGRALIDDITAMGTPLLVLSGGDPLKRPDLPVLVRHGKARGLRVATIPAATPLLTATAVQALAEAGLDQIAFSVDASTGEAHDSFRGVPGAFARTLSGIRWAHAAGLPVQINTVIRRSSLGDLEAMIRLVRQLDIVFWEVFFLVPVGRGAVLEGLTAAEYETAFSRLARLAQEASFVVKVTEAPHFRRHLLQRRLHGGQGPRPPQPRTHIGLAPQPLNAGKGHAFVAADGEIYPSGFLPLSAGNVRTAALSTVYRTSPLFQALRDPARLQGRCGQCEYRIMCGGSRARAYAMTGDYLAEDPCCAYDPAARCELAWDGSRWGE